MAASCSKARPRSCGRTPTSRSFISGSTKSGRANPTATSSTTSAANAGCREPGVAAPASATHQRGRAKIGSDDPFGAQRFDLAGTDAEPLAEHFGIVLAEQWRGLDPRRCAVEANRPCRDRQFAGGRVLDLLHDAALGERGIVQQLERVE